jgi:hypothetical protein
VEKNYQEFDFGKFVIDYERIIQRLKKGEMTRKEIHEMIPNVSYSVVSEIITTLCINYAVYSPRHGVYKLLTDEDMDKAEQEMRDGLV